MNLKRAPTTLADAKKMVSFALDPALLARWDKWLDSQDMPPSKTTFLENAIRKLLDEVEVKKATGSDARKIKKEAD